MLSLHRVVQEEEPEPLPRSPTPCYSPMPPASIATARDVGFDADSEWGDSAPWPAVPPDDTDTYSQMDRPPSRQTLDEEVEQAAAPPGVVTDEGDW